MLNQAELRYRVLIFLILLLAGPWLENLLLCIFSFQYLPINAALKLNDYLHLQPLLVIAIALCFWPLFLPKLLEFTLKRMQQPGLKNIPLIITLTWCVFILDFIFMQQGLL